MPIDPQRFPVSDRPRVEVRRRARRPVAARTAAASAPRNVADASEAEPFEPPTILPIVFPKVKSAAASTPAPAPLEDPAPPEAPAPIDVRATLLGPSEMAVKEVPTLRYDAEELAPMLEEMAVRKVLLEQTLVRMRQALDEEGEEIEREAAAIAVERTASADGFSTAPSPSTKAPTRPVALGAFFWLGTTVATALLSWGLLWLLRGALFEPALLRTGGVIALFGLVALASNAVLHLDALLPRKTRAAV